jgi:hypothetical protein
LTRFAESAGAGGTQTTGNGDDYAIEVSGLISSATGTFPSVTGVTSEKSVGVAAFGGGGILGANEYTLQVNSNYNKTTSVCKSHSGCTVWQQFIYSPDYSTKGKAAVFIQYWLLGYGGTSCPSGFGSDGSGDCYKNSSAVTAPDVPATQLANLKISGTATTGGNDTVVFTNGTTAYTLSAKDSVLDIASVMGPDGVQCRRQRRRIGSGVQLRLIDHGESRSKRRQHCHPDVRLERRLNRREQQLEPGQLHRHRWIIAVDRVHRVELSIALDVS